MSDKQYIAYEGAHFTIEWYFLENGNSEALTYYQSLEGFQRRKLLFLFKRMGDHGKISDLTKFNHEGDQIYAFKPQPERFLCFFVKGGKILVTHGFRKKQQKLPIVEKERALAYQGLGVEVKKIHFGIFCRIDRIRESFGRLLF